MSRRAGKTHNLSRWNILVKEYGYKTLILWDYELKDLKKVKNKINKFQRL